jgi:hypothetical protein
MVARSNAAAETVRRHAKIKPPAPSQRAVDLDRVIHERSRLGMVSALAVNESLTFTELKGLLGVIDGNSIRAR